MALDSQLVVAGLKQRLVRSCSGDIPNLDVDAHAV